MKRSMILVIALAAVAAPAALATPSPQAPSAYCKANPTLIGEGKTFATMGACVSKQAALAAGAHTNAARACKAEMADPAFPAAHGGKTFDQFYGTNGGNGNAGGNGKGGGNGSGNGNALGNCVSQKAAAKTAGQQAAQTNAAKKCRTPDLKAQIGPGKTYRNFGACVAAQGTAAS
jgi:hypothetical protein